jgi:hypothetical protein
MENVWGVSRVRAGRPPHPGLFLCSELKHGELKMGRETGRARKGAILVALQVVSLAYQHVRDVRMAIRNRIGG